MHQSEIKIGLIAERKNPPDKRVAFTPAQCLKIQAEFPGIKILVEPSPMRCIPDREYEALGIPVSNDLSDAEILFGIKEVPIEALIPGKTYFFFSHTIKKQAHNRRLLQELLSRKIEMVDYECLLDEKGGRTVAFGRFAGIVGAYNSLRIWLRRNANIELKNASDCSDMVEMLNSVRPFVEKIGNVRIAVTGTGRVGLGAIEVLENLGIKRVQPVEFISEKFNEPVFTVLSSRHYLRHKDNKPWNEAEFRTNPSEFVSGFMDFAKQTDILIPCHYWDPAAPALFSKEDISQPEFRISVISDVTCDIEGSIPTTLRASTIKDPFYDISRETCQEKAPFSNPENISICAVDNLPCELPLDASEAFGEMLMQHVIPELVSDKKPGIEGATITKNGQLCANFSYLKSFSEEF